MLTSAALAVLLTVASQTDAGRLSPPERPIFGFPTEDAVRSPSSTPPADNPLLDRKKNFPEAYYSDARLNDVCFVDEFRGWAVGDRGAIWHTEDGGRQWRLQPTGVDCSLQSVCFLTEKVGWAAGGSAEPYSHAGRGTLLATRDGGQTWTGNPRLVLPALKRIVFTDPEHGWAVGSRSAMYPSGVFSTDDGGRSWRPLAGSVNSAWLTGDFLGPNVGAVAGCHASAATVKRGEVEPAQTGDYALQNFRQLRLVPPAYGWLVGDGGLAMLTGDAGATWRVPAGVKGSAKGDSPIFVDTKIGTFPDTKIGTAPDMKIGTFPMNVMRHFDFAALAVLGPKAWIAGTPGTRIFYTPDAGGSWTSFPTGISTPICAITFIDEQRGWAVGALGTILATSDGGRTWQRQRSGGSRAALLCLVAETGDVPLELLAKISGNDGYLSAVDMLTRRDVEIRPGEETTLAERLHQAVIAVGGSQAGVAWQFPIRQTGVQVAADDYIKAWDLIHDGRGLEAMEEHIVAQLRIWRPNVVFTNDVKPLDADQLRQLVGKTVVRAVAKAADPNSYPEQITDAGLAPWQAKLIYAAAEPGSHGSIDISTSQFSARLGRSLAEAAADPRGLLTDRFAFTPITLGLNALGDCPNFRVNENGTVPFSSKIGTADFFGGLALAQGDCRRELVNAPRENLDMLERSALKLRNIQAILEQAQRNPDSEIKLFAQSGELIRGLDDENAGRILYYLGDRYRNTGRWPLAAETFQLLADRYPRHPLSRPALLWLVQYYASGEAAWREQSMQKAGMGQTPAIALDGSKLEDRLARAAALGKRIERSRPDLFAEPALRFPLAAAWQTSGSPRLAEQFYMVQSHSVVRDAWSACAAGEMWLADPKGNQPKPSQHCWRAAAKPKLDGRLDDAIWQKIESAPLKSGDCPNFRFNENGTVPFSAIEDDEWPAVVAFAHDDEFLYLAITCHRAPDVKYEPAAAARARDADLTAGDRVDVFFDIDRDFATYYRLSVDYRGFTADSCWGDPTWNPTWYVAAELTDDVWTVEAAIPLDQLAWGRHSAGAVGKDTGNMPGPPVNKIWAVGVQRTVPGVGFQSWSTPAGADVMPQGFGHLIFD
jgi:photosystem II stability/assembly factor-like uncharacterized protein